MKEASLKQKNEVYTCCLNFRNQLKNVGLASNFLQWIS
jgi:hypothetical protein